MPDRILIVDDETEIADLIETYLKNENYTVFQVLYGGGGFGMYQDDRS